MLTIYIPAYSDSAYAYIGTHKMEARIDSFDLKLLKYDATDVHLIFNKHKNDTIYCGDESVTLINNSGKYKKSNGMMKDSMYNLLKIYLNTI